MKYFLTFITWLLVSPALAQTCPPPVNGIVYAGSCGAVAGGSATMNRLAFQAAIDQAFGPASAPHGGGTGSTANLRLEFPNGLFDIDQPLVFTQVQGGKITGAGRFSTWIRNQSGSVFVTNCMQYSEMDGMLLDIGPGGSGIELDCSGTGSVSLQSNTFSNMFFSGGAYGVRIGRSGNMGSENLFLNDFFATSTVACLQTGNYNALQQTVIGGNFQTCQIGIYVNGGSVNIVQGVGFQQSVDYDIRIDTASTNTMHVSGNRSESQNFFFIGGGSNASLHDNTHVGLVRGTFAHYDSGTGVVEGNRSTMGQFFAQGNTRVSIRNSCFDRADWLNLGGLWPDSVDTGIGEILLDQVCWNGLTQLIRKQRWYSTGKSDTQGNNVWNYD